KSGATRSRGRCTLPAAATGPSRRGIQGRRGPPDDRADGDGLHQGVCGELLILLENQEFATNSLRIAERRKPASARRFLASVLEAELGDSGRDVQSVLPFE